MDTIMRNETLIGENNIAGIEKFTVTDKRLIYNNNIIGIRELRSAEVKEMPLNFNRMNLPPYQVMAAFLTILTLVVVYSYICITGEKHGIQFGDLAPLFISFLSLFGIVPVLMLIIYGIQSFTSYNENKAVLYIIKTDNTYWINQYYDPTYKPELDKLVNQINVAIYK